MAYARGAAWVQWSDAQERQQHKGNRVQTHDRAAAASSRCVLGMCVGSLQDWLAWMQHVDLLPSYLFSNNAISSSYPTHVSSSYPTHAPTTSMRYSTRGLLCVRADRHRKGAHI
jgi:hypothetical protein